jgi:hypothetical protein
MEELIISSDLFKKIVSNAEEVIKNGTTNDWINCSSLIKRAYYLGVINALELIAEDEDLKRLAINAFQKTMFQQDIDVYIKTEIDKNTFERKNEK